GFVSGYVTAGANKGTAGEVPVANMRIYLVNQTTNTPVASTLTNASGVYSFSNIAAGTYKVFPEALGYITTPASSVNVSTSSSSFTFSFYQHTISKTITLIPAGVTNVVANENEVSVYPNPANNTLSVNVTVSGAEKAMVTLTDMTGRAIISKSVTLNAGAATTNFDVKAVANGVYFLNVRAAGFDRTDKIEIAH
ncbi:MAG: T9SS C-terminal target domain-containing protein, partial [Chitinophagia bacterium]|nr:T9SS C-terminal target domain-containing protein [Chitinophagia bacterium]